MSSRNIPAMYRSDAALLQNLGCILLPINGKDGSNRMHLDNVVPCPSYMASYDIMIR